MVDPVVILYVLKSVPRRLSALVSMTVITEFFSSAATVCFAKDMLPAGVIAKDAWWMV
jgi:hypothetical protein